MLGSVRPSVSLYKFFQLVERCRYKGIALHLFYSDCNWVDKYPLGRSLKSDQEWGIASCYIEKWRRNGRAVFKILLNKNTPNYSNIRQFKSLYNDLSKKEGAYKPLKWFAQTELPKRTHTSWSDDQNIKILVLNPFVLFSHTF